MEDFKPVIGIMCIDRDHNMPPETKSYISCPYIPYYEECGAQIVPIWINKPRAYYEAIMNKVNGIVIPGGAVFLAPEDVTDNLPNSCVQSADFILDIAIKKFNAGRPLPIWGTCFGLQVMVVLTTSTGDDCRESCSKMRGCFPMQFCEDFRTSRLFKELPDDMKGECFGRSNHRFCIVADCLKKLKYKYNMDWHVLTTGSDENGKEFVNTMESRRYPFWGSQIHPERTLSDDPPETQHDSKAIRAAEYFGKFFVNECRKNTNRFASIEEKQQHLIKNFESNIKVCGDKHNYEFPDGIDYPGVVEVNKNDEACKCWNT